MSGTDYNNDIYWAPSEPSSSPHSDSSITEPEDFSTFEARHYLSLRKHPLSPHLELEGPRNTPEHVIHACYELELPNTPTPRSPEHPVTIGPVVFPTIADDIRERFTKIVTVAAKARTLLMRPFVTEESIRTSYLSLAEAFTSLKSYLHTLSFEDDTWLDAGPIPAAFPNTTETAGEATRLLGDPTRLSGDPTRLMWDHTGLSTASLLQEIGEFRRGARAALAKAAEAEALAAELVAAAVDAVGGAPSSAATAPAATAASTAAAAACATPAAACATPAASPPPDLDCARCDCGPRSGLYCINPLAHSPYPRLSPDDIFMSPVHLTPSSTSMDYSVDAPIKWAPTQRAQATPRAAGQPISAAPLRGAGPPPRSSSLAQIRQPSVSQPAIHASSSLAQNHQPFVPQPASRGSSSLAQHPIHPFSLGHLLALRLSPSAFQTRRYMHTIGSHGVPPDQQRLIFFGGRPHSF